MASPHIAVFHQDKTFRKLFTKEELDNLVPMHHKGAKTRHKNCWVDIPNKPGWIRVFTEWGIVECRRKDPNGGPKI